MPPRPTAITRRCKLHFRRTATVPGIIGSAKGVRTHSTWRTALLSTAANPETERTTPCRDSPAPLIPTTWYSTDASAVKRGNPWFLGLATPGPSGGAPGALALDRLQELTDGRFAYRLRHAWSDGTETLIFEPGTLIEKLVALVPRPNGRLTRFPGVLAPRSSWRAAIVLRPAVRDEGAQTGAGEGRGQRAGTRPSWAMLLSRVFSVDLSSARGVGPAAR